MNAYEALARRAAGGDLSAAKKLVRLLEANVDDQEGPDVHKDPVGRLVWLEAREGFGPASIRALKDAPYAKGYEHIVDQAARRLLLSWVGRNSGVPLGAFEVAMARTVQDEVQTIAMETAADAGMYLMGVMNLPGGEGGEIAGSDEGSHAIIGAVLGELQRNNRIVVADVRNRIGELIEDMRSRQ